MKAIQCPFLCTVWCVTWLTFPNCRKSWSRAPFPNGFVRLAWKANVGYSVDRVATHFCWNDTKLRIWCFARIWVLQKKTKQIKEHWKHTAAHRDPSWNQITLVEHKDEMLVNLLLLHVILNVFGSCAHRVPCIQHLYHNIRGINHLKVAQTTDS